MTRAYSRFLFDPWRSIEKVDRERKGRRERGREGGRDGRRFVLTLRQC
jgi:hypothetical protein